MKIMSSIKSISKKLLTNSPSVSILLFRDWYRKPSQLCLSMAYINLEGSGFAGEDWTLFWHQNAFPHRKGQEIRCLDQPTSNLWRSFFFYCQDPHFLHSKKVFQSDPEFFLHKLSSCYSNDNDGNYWRKCNLTLGVRHQRETIDCANDRNHSSLHAWWSRVYNRKEGNDAEATRMDGNSGADCFKYCQVQWGDWGDHPSLLLCYNPWRILEIETEPWKIRGNSQQKHGKPYKLQWREVPINAGSNRSLFQGLYRALRRRMEDSITKIGDKSTSKMIPNSFY